jgi:superfamily I DNA/RNA helicase
MNERTMSHDAAPRSNANLQQREAILTIEGPVLIIAGPGSGKTHTLVERVVHLITQKDVAPGSLLVVTFTEKAARELTTRISDRLMHLGVKFNLHEMYVGTFHSICLRLVEDFREFTRLKRSFTLFDEFDQQYFLYQHIKNFRELVDAQLVIRDLFNRFLRFLIDGGIGEYEDESEFAPSGSVSFLTIHQSKGLEFPVVVCGSLEAVPRNQHGELDVLLEEGGYSFTLSLVHGISISGLMTVRMSRPPSLSAWAMRPKPTSRAGAPCQVPPWSTPRMARLRRSSTS